MTLQRAPIGECISRLYTRMDQQACLCMTNPGISMPGITEIPSFMSRVEKTKLQFQQDIGSISPSGLKPLAGSAYRRWSPGGPPPQRHDLMSLSSQVVKTGSLPCSSCTH